GFFHKAVLANGVVKERRGRVERGRIAVRRSQRNVERKGYRRGRLVASHYNRMLESDLIVRDKGGIHSRRAISDFELCGKIAGRLEEEPALGIHPDRVDRKAHKVRGPLRE